MSNFGLVDAIESGIVTIPRLPVLDTTGRPDPRSFKFWDAIKDGLQPAEWLPGRACKPKPEVVYREVQGALQQIAGQWVERFRYLNEAIPGHATPATRKRDATEDVYEIPFSVIPFKGRSGVKTELADKSKNFVRALPVSICTLRTAMNRIAWYGLQGPTRRERLALQSRAMKTTRPCKKHQAA